MKKFIYLLSFLCLPLLLCAQGIAPSQISAAVPAGELVHPYLLFTNESKTAILERIEKEPESRRIMTELLARAPMLLAQPVDKAIPPRTTNNRAGWTETDRQNDYLSKQNRYAGYAQELAFLYQMTGQEVYAQKAFEFAEYVCTLPTWTMQAHEFPIIYSRVMPWNVPDDQVNFNFDLGNAGTGSRMALIYDWLYPALNTRQRDQIRGALLEHVITPVRGDYEFHWWTTSYRCNWTGVCFSGLGITAMALLKDHPQLVDVIAESYNGISKMMDQIGIDGGWQEGGSYWRYGLDGSFLFGHALRKASGGQFNLFRHEKLIANPVSFPLYFFIPPAGYVDFGDANAGKIDGTDFFNLLAQETGSGEAAWYRQNILGEGTDFFDLIFPRPEITPRAPTTFSRHFRTIDWWVMRSNDFLDPEKVVVAGKAGKNDDPHHGHLDIGHFVLYWRGEAFIKDSGRAYYDEKYFDEQRWTYPQAASAGHNVVFVNDEPQIPGKLRGQPFNFDIGGKVLDFQTTPQRDYVLMDPSNAYPRKELRQWRRHLILEKPQITLVMDEITATGSHATVKVRFHSAAAADIRQNLILLKGQKGTMALIPFTRQAFKLQSGEHAYQPIHATRPFEWLPYFEILVNPDQARTTVGTLLVPVLNEQEAAEVAQSIQVRAQDKMLQVQFKYQKKEYSYRFQEDGEGLKFK